MKLSTSAMVWWRRLFAVIGVVMATLYLRDAFGAGPVMANAIKGGIWVALVIYALVLEMLARIQAASPAQE